MLGVWSVINCSPGITIVERQGWLITFFNLLGLDYQEEQIKALNWNETETTVTPNYYVPSLHFHVNGKLEKQH